MNFIYSAPNALSEKQCNRIIKYFELHPEFHQQGTTQDTKGLHSHKQSIDWCKDFNDEDAVDLMIEGVVKEHTDNYVKKFKGINYSNNRSFMIDPLYNLQKYNPGGGFKGWHHEYDCFTQPPRLLAWMIYLNTVPDGGTMFLDQDMTIDAEVGKLLIWPAYWTHTHKSQVSETSEKYIATGWHVYTKQSDDWTI